MLIGLVIIIVGAAAVVLFIQRRNRQEIAALDQEVGRLGSAQIEKNIQAMRSLNLTGESLKSFTKWQREYQTTSEEFAAQIETALMDAENANNQFRFGKTKTAIVGLNTLISGARGRYKQVLGALNQIRQDEEQNRTQLAKLKKTYQETRKTLLAKNFAFGDSMPALEERLKDLADEFTAVDEVSASGDHHAAHERIQTLSGHVHDLADLTAAIPPLLTELIKEFPEQLAELQNGYDKLTQQNYNFGDLDIPSKLQTVKVGIDNSKTALASLNTSAATEQNKVLAHTIDSLYDAMEREMTARRAVEQDSDRITQFIAHAQRQNHLLLLELDHLDQSYSLNHDEIPIAQKLRTELVEFDNQHQIDLQAIADKQATYSQIDDHYKAADKRLREIEQQQHDINESVSTLKAGEDSANRALDDFTRDLHGVRRQLEAAKLPGLPVQFKDRVAHVATEINDIGKQLSKIKIDLDDINQQLIGLQSDMDDLQQDATEIIDAVGLMAALIQASNRYRDEHPELKEAATKAKALYAQIHYKEAADVMATALEKAVPGSYRHVEDAYLNEKTNDEM
ncbi:septation ring formation regulator EzrA [Lacticaseibacillus hulanensis]|uniref:septation ring formation regulator EzrA n=1 Tax=Lacticaseibacillus hulanensis TaxID=2493111 RepID=UPI00240DDBAD|nr:septation ring formation regulator EzrA [Lacticaseibacillus hulanensis]